VRRLVLGLVLGLTCLVLWGPSAGASTSTVAAEAAPTARKLPPGFVPIKGKEEAAKTPAGPLVVGAYAAVLAGLLFYVVYIARAQAALQARLDAMQRERDRA